MSGLLGSGGSQSTAPKRLQAIELQKSAYGEVIPLVYGRTRVAPTLIWYGDFRAIAHTEEVGGKGGGQETTSYTYRAALVMAICEGTIDEVLALWSDKGYYDPDKYNFVYFDGSPSQAAWAYLTSNHSTQAIPYVNTALACSSNFNLGSSAAMPNLGFLVQGPLAVGGGINEANPAAIIEDYLTDLYHGAEFEDLGDLTEFSTYCHAMGLFISPAEMTQRQAADFLQELLKLTNCEAVWTGGELTIVPRMDEAVTGNSVTYTPDLTPEFELDDDDFAPAPGDPPVEIERKALDEVFNRVRVEFLDANHNYNTNIAEAYDDAHIGLHGERVMDTVSFHCITSAITARLVAQLILQRQLYAVNQYRFRLRADYSLLDAMDLVAITDTTLGLESQLVRILEITDEDDDFLSLLVEEVPVGSHSAPRYDWELAQGYAENYGTSPGSVEPPVLFAAPPYLVGPAGGAEIWVAVCGLGAAWGGCNVWASFDDLDYRIIGRITQGARYGELTNSMTAVTSDPDTTSVPRISLVDTDMTLDNASQDDVDNFRALILVGDEVMAFRDVSLVSAGTYDIDYLRRGLYGTEVEAHSSTEQFVRLDNAIFPIPFDPGMAGQTLYLKFTSINIYGFSEEEVADVPSYSIQIPTGYAGYVGDAAPMLVTGTAAVTGYSAYKPVGVSGRDSYAYSQEWFSNGCSFSFQVAFPGKQMTAGLESDAGAITANDLLEYSFRFFVGGWRIYENGTDISGASTAYTKQTVFAIAYDGKTIRYFVDGVLIRATPAANKVFFCAAGFSDVGAQIEKIRWQDATGVPGTNGNKLSTIPWIINGIGTQGSYVDHYDGVNADSSIILAGASAAPLGPYGQTEALWRAAGAGAAANGGWDNQGDLYGVDPTKSHRACVWIRWNGTGTPTISFGCSVTNTFTLAGASASNPWFFSGNPATLGLTANKWYLAVGIVHASSHGTTDTGVSGLYDPATGQRVYGGTEFKFASSTPIQTHRVHQDSASNSSCVTYFSKPRWDELNGDEPSLAILMSPSGALAYLDEVDTDHLAEYAATEVYVVSEAGPVDVLDSTAPYTTWTTVESISVPAQDVDTEQILVFTGSVDHHIVSGQTSAYARINYTGASWPLGAGAHAEISRNISTSEPDIGATFAIELVESIPAGTPMTYDFQAFCGLGVSSSFVNLQGVTCKVIVVKR